MEENLINGIAKVHPEAIKNFNKRVDQLRERMVQQKDPSVARKTFPSEVHVDYQLTEESGFALSPISEIVNTLGEITGVEFGPESARLGIYEIDFVELKRLSEDLLRKTKLYDHLSHTVARKLIYEWLNDPHSGNNFFNYFVDKSIEEIEVHNIWLPIKFLEIEKEFYIGPVRLTPMSKKMTREIVDLILKIEDFNSGQEIIDNYFLKSQGYAVANITIRSDIEKAREVICHETIKALSLLQVFSRGCLYPTYRTNYGIWGDDESTSCFTFIYDDGFLSHINDGFMDTFEIVTKISNYQIDKYMDAGLQELSRILGAENRSEFEEKVLEAVLIYSGCSKRSDPADKLIYIFSALESLFLKNKGEPVQQNLSERISFLSKQTVEDRKLLIKNIKDAYELRSKFVHHGGSINDYDTLEQFLVNAWETMMDVVSVAQKFKTKEDFIVHIETKKFS